MLGFIAYIRNDKYIFFHTVNFQGEFPVQVCNSPTGSTFHLNCCTNDGLLHFVQHCTLHFDSQSQSCLQK